MITTESDLLLASESWILLDIRKLQRWDCSYTHTQNGMQDNNVVSTHWSYIVSLSSKITLIKLTKIYYSYVLTLIPCPSNERKCVKTTVFIHFKQRWFDTISCPFFSSSVNSFHFYVFPWNKYILWKVRDLQASPKLNTLQSR